MKKIVWTMLWSLSLLVAAFGWADPTPVTLKAGSTTIHAQLPEGVGSIIRQPQQDSTFVQGTKGSESLEIGRSDDFDIYSIQVFDPVLLKKHGHEAGVTDLDKFIATEIQFYNKNFQLVDREQNIPQALKASASKSDRYVLVAGAYNKQKNRKAKAFLWRVMLVNGQFVVAQREIGGGYAAKNKVNLKHDSEWDFLRSVSVNGIGSGSGGGGR